MRHENPLTGNRGASSPGGLYLLTEETEPDPGGVDAGKSNPYTGGMVVPPNDGMATLLGGAFGAGKCLYNGIKMDCEDVEMMARNGSAVPDPSQPPASGLVGGRRVVWIEAWEPCSEGDACARNVGYFATEQGGGSPLATRLTPQIPAQPVEAPLSQRDAKAVQDAIKYAQKIVKDGGSNCDTALA